MGTVLEKANKIKETKNKLKEAINIGGGQITDDTIFNDYPKQILKEYVKIINNGTDELYANFPKIEDEGTELNLNTEEAPMKITLEGNTSQDGDPTPDTPIPIKVVTGEQNVTIQNKNLLDTSESNTTLYAYFNSTNGNVVNDGTKTNCIFNEYIKVKPNTSYTMSSDKITSSSIYTYVEYDKNKNFLKYYSTGSLSRKALTFITGSNTAYIRIRYKWSTGVTITNEIIENNKIQLENGSTATTYVPYQSQTYPLSLGNIELAKIRNYKDYIFKNVVGSPYYNADLDLNKWYLHKEIGKVVLDGSEEYTRGFKNKTDYYGICITDGLANPLWINASTPAAVYCDKLTGYSFNDLYYSTTINEGICFDTKNSWPVSPFVIMLAKSRLNTISESGVKVWLASNNLTIYYQKATPTNTKITDTTLITQLENLDNAHSYLGTTIIECSSLIEDNETVKVSATALERIS